MTVETVNTIGELLIAMAGHDDAEMRQAAARNPALPVDRVDALAGDPVWYVRLAAAAHPACPEATRARVLEAAAASDDEHDRFGAVTHPRCPPRLLATLAGDERWLFRQHVAFHPDAPGEVLAALLRDPEEPVRVVAARHPRVPMSVTEAPEDAREAAAANDEAAPEVLLALADDDAPGVHCAVARNPRAPAEALERIAAQRDRLIRLIVLKNPGCPAGVLATWVEQPAEYGDAIAENPRADPDVLRRLSDDPDLWPALARNPSCPSDVLEVLATRGVLVKQAVAANPNTPAEVLHTLARSKTLKHFVAKNPSCPAELLDRLAKSKDVVVLRGVAANPHPPARHIPRMVAAGVWRLLERADCPDAAFEVPPADERHRACLAGHARDADQIAALAGDRDAHVRQAAAKNPRCPVDTLLALACDSNEHVADAALTALARLDESQSDRLRGPVTVPALPAAVAEELPPLPEPSPIDPALRNRLCSIDNQEVLDEALGHSGRDGFIELYVSAMEDAQDLVQMSTIDGTMLEIVFHGAADAICDGSLQIAGVLMFESVCADDLADELADDPDSSAFLSAATMYEYTTPLLCDQEGNLFVVTPDSLQPLDLRWSQLSLTPR